MRLGIVALALIAVTRPCQTHVRHGSGSLAMITYIGGVDDIRVLRHAWWYRATLWGCRLSVLGIPLMILGALSRTFLVAGAVVLAVPWMWFGLVHWYVTVEYDVSYGQFIDRLMDDIGDLRYW